MQMFPSGISLHIWRTASIAINSVSRLDDEKDGIQCYIFNLGIVDTENRVVAIVCIYNFHGSLS